MRILLAPRTPVADLTVVSSRYSLSRPIAWATPSEDRRIVFTTLIVSCYSGSEP